MFDLSGTNVKELWEFGNDVSAGILLLITWLK
jgi:hypothetical protein